MKKCVIYFRSISTLSKVATIWLTRPLKSLWTLKNLCVSNAAFTKASTAGCSSCRSSFQCSTASSKKSQCEKDAIPSLWDASSPRAYSLFSSTQDICKLMSHRHPLSRHPFTFLLFFPPVPLTSTRRCNIFSSSIFSKIFYKFL